MYVLLIIIRVLHNSASLRELNLPSINTIVAPSIALGLELLKLTISFEAAHGVASGDQRLSN